MTLQNSPSNNGPFGEGPSDEGRSNPDRRRLLEALDACRPGSDDFDRLLDARLTEAIRADAELTARYRRLQAFDGVVGRAFADATVPAGLDARLMAALAADALVSHVEDQVGERSTGGTPRQELRPAGGAAAAGAAGAVSAVGERVEAGRFSRRGWMAACGATAAATAAGLAGLWLLRSTQPGEMTVEQLLDEAFALHQQPEGELPPAVAIDPRNPPSDYPLSAKVGHRRDVVPRRRNLDGRLLGRPGVAYELAAPGTPRATLFVLGDGRGARGVAGVPHSVSGHPDKTTGNRALGAWREEGLLYVFVVEGDDERYRRYFSESTEVFA